MLLVASGFFARKARCEARHARVIAMLVGFYALRLERKEKIMCDEG